MPSTVPGTLDEFTVPDTLDEEKEEEEMMTCEDLIAKSDFSLSKRNVRVLFMICGEGWWEKAQWSYFEVSSWSKCEDFKMFTFSYLYLKDFPSCHIPNLVWISQNFLYGYKQKFGHNFFFHK